MLLGIESDMKLNLCGPCLCFLPLYTDPEESVIVYHVTQVLMHFCILGEITSERYWNIAYFKVFVYLYNSFKIENSALSSSLRGDIHHLTIRYFCVTSRALFGTEQKDTLFWSSRICVKVKLRHLLTRSNVLNVRKKYSDGPHHKLI
jgi:hypothetical protein